jgi:hypothetical protein
MMSMTFSKIFLREKKGFAQAKKWKSLRQQFKTFSESHGNPAPWASGSASSCVIGSSVQIIKRKA